MYSLLQVIKFVYELYHLVDSQNPFFLSSELLSGQNVLFNESV